MADTFDVKWDDVQLVNQPSGMSCWAASAAMVVGWQKQISIDVPAIVNGLGDWAAYKDGLAPSKVPDLATAWGLTMEAPQCYTVDALKQMVAEGGPLWVVAQVPGVHAIVVTGLYGDGTPDGTFVRINDPWDRDPGTPGAPGDYKSTHDSGSQYVLTITQFMNEYEAIASDAGWNVQILRTDGRSQ